MSTQESTLEKTRTRLRELVEERGMPDERVEVTGRPLTPEEAIGTPGRRDFPIVLGKERVLEARVRGARGHAFTDTAREYLGTLREVLELPLESNAERAVFIATLNAVLANLGMAKGTVHCKDDDPERCAEEIANTILDRHGRARVGLVGLNPAIAERLCSVFGPGNVRITDLNRDNIGKRKFDVEIWDGRTRSDDLADFADVVILTGTTLVNGTFDSLLDAIRSRGKQFLIYGVTTAGVCALLGLERICPLGQDG